MIDKIIGNDQDLNITLKNLKSEYLNKRIDQLIQIYDINGESKLKEIESSSGEFNSKWNERYGNDLAAATLSYEFRKSESTLQIIEKIIDIILSADSLKTNGMEHDEVNIYHIVLGLFIADKHIKPSQREKTNELYFKTLYESTLNNTSNWYIDDCKLHNHVFHLVCLRLICHVYLKEYSNIDAEDELTKLRLKFSENLNVMSNLYCGLTNESASYLSYTATSISNILLIERSFNKISYRFSTDNLFRYIDDTFFEEECFSFNFSDAPFNWSYGPETWLRYLGYYNGRSEYARKIIHRIERSRMRKFDSKEINRNQHAFLYLNFISDNLGDIGNEEVFDTTHDKESNYDQIGIHCIKTPSLQAVIHYGRPGGKFIEQLTARNFGHDYPSIGGIGLAINGKLAVANPLYLKPKNPQYASIATYENSTHIITQIGEFEKNSGIASPNWLDSKSIKKWSPIDVKKIHDTLIYTISIEINSEIKHCRALLITGGNSAIFIDIIKSNKPIIGNIIFANPLHRFTAKKDLPSINTITIKARSNCNITTTIDDTQLDCHEFKYNLSQLTLRNVEPNFNPVFITEFSDDMPFSSISVDDNTIIFNNDKTLKISAITGDIL